MSDEPIDQPILVICRCNLCDGGIEFDAQDFQSGETRFVECPHCKMETILFVPPDETSKLPILQPFLTHEKAADFLYSITDAQKTVDLDRFYTIILSPGVVRYLEPVIFWNTDIEKLISATKQVSENPAIKTPEYFVANWTADDSSFFEKNKRLSHNKPTLQSSLIDCFIEDESWENKLRVHHSFGHFLLNCGLPSHVYSFFHNWLQLEKNFAFEECVNSWVALAIENKDLAESYKKSPEHVVVIINEDEVSACFVFKMTDFLKERIAINARDAEEESVAEEAEKLRKSNYSTFIYIMQDMRNGAFKIGRSITPGKRERTLQSEVPEIVMRFSIPADEAHEKHLHDYFESKNSRGEWFALEPSDLLWVISYLKQHGDIERAFVNHEWLGQVFLRAKA
jgi:hypothetical protein